MLISKARAASRSTKPFNVSRTFSRPYNIYSIYDLTHIFAGGIDTRSGTGLAIPDGESYYLWQDFYDAVIDARHNHPPGSIHETDLDYILYDNNIYVTVTQLTSLS